MPATPQTPFLAWLAAVLAEDPLACVWPREFGVAGPSGAISGLWDAHNELLVLHGAGLEDLAAAELAPVLAAGEGTSAPCSRVLVFARPGGDQGWAGLGFGPEGEIPGYWADGETAVLRARMWGARAVAAATPDPKPPTVRPPGSAPPALPPGWRGRVAEPEDAPAIRDLLLRVFPGYPIPTDPAAIGYALAAGLVHGRVVTAADGVVVAYASAEFQPGGGAPEITDCATTPGCRGRGLMGRVVAGLLADLGPLFGLAAAYALVRRDSPAMGRVLARAGWRPAGGLAAHYRVAGAWVGADLWASPDEVAVSSRTPPPPTT